MSAAAFISLAAVAGLALGAAFAVIDYRAWRANVLCTK